MSTYRISKDKDNPYVMVNKACLDDAALSLKAKGLLTYLLSLPDDWQIYEDEIVKHHKDGRDSIRSAIKELMRAGYIIRERQRDELGRLRQYDYTVYERPQKRPNNADAHHSGLSYIGNPDTTNTQRLSNKINYMRGKREQRKIEATYELMEQPEIRRRMRGSE